MLEYECQGDGAPLVLLPPFPFNHEVFTPQLAQAATDELKGEVFVLKLPGFGSPWPPDHPPVLRVEDLAREVIDLMDELAMGRAIIAGAGLGGYAAIHALAANPDRFAGGLVMGCKPGVDPRTRRAERARIAEVALTEGSRAAAELLAVAALADSKRRPRSAQARAMVESADPRAIAAGIWGVHLRPDPSLVAERITVPVIVGVGSDDPICGVDAATSLATLLPNGSLQVIPECGHAAPLERPDVVSLLLAELLADIR